jgi:hypothetical protein
MFHLQQYSGVGPGGIVGLPVAAANAIEFFYSCKLFTPSSFLDTLLWEKLLLSMMLSNKCLRLAH